MKHLLILINSAFWKSIIGPFFAFGFPVLFIAILGSLLGYQAIFGGTLAIASMTIALSIMPQSILEFKNSVLLKRIGVTPIKPWMFVLIVVSYYFVLMFFSTFITLLIGMLIFSGNWAEGKLLSEENTLPEIFAPPLQEYLANANWGNFIWGVLMNILVGATFGMMVASLVKNALMIQAFTMPILIGSQFLAAQVLPIELVKGSEVMWIMSYMTPFKYSTGLMIESFNGVVVLPAVNSNLMQWTLEPATNIFDIHQKFTVINSAGNNIVDIFSPVDKVLNLVMPFVFSSIFAGISIKTFKWSTR